MIWKHHFINII